MISQDLKAREAEGRPIRVGVSGAGWTGSGFVRQVAQMAGMRVNVLADADVEAARQAFIDSGVTSDRIVEADNPAEAMDALRAGKRVISGSYQLAAQLEAVDIVAEVTSSPAVGAETAWSCIQYGKDVVMVNIEADVTVGRLLKQMSDKAGLLYTVSSGDEPGCLMELYDFVTGLGYEPIVIGKGKNNPLDPQATPDSVAESARKAQKDAYQVASYVDGTKTMFEMTCAANATGCRPMTPGMCGPQADRESVSRIFALEEDGGITRFPGVVDFVQGTDMAGGVFVTVRIRDERIRADLEYLKVGKGKYFTFFRPYHLWFLEAPLSVARAHLYRQATLRPLDEPVAEVMAVAKRDLHPGERLDEFGGYTCYGVMDLAEAATRQDALPIGLAPGARVVCQVEKGSVIGWEDVELDEGSLVVQLRREMDGKKLTMKNTKDSEY
jgi:predicted homoserine dehydrogenase-like protein